MKRFSTCWNTAVKISSRVFVHWRDLTQAEWQDRDERAVAELKATGAAQPFQKECFRKDGSRVPVLFGAAMFEGSGNEGVAFVLDFSKTNKNAPKKLYVLVKCGGASWLRFISRHCIDCSERPLHCSKLGSSGNARLY